MVKQQKCISLICLRADNPIIRDESDKKSN